MNHSDLSDISRLPAPLTEGGLFAGISWDSPEQAAALLQSAIRRANDRSLVEEILPPFLREIRYTPAPQSCLARLERLVSIGPATAELLAALREHPRGIEILVRVFVSSDYLTQILLRQPNSFARLVDRMRLTELKSREQFCDEACEAAGKEPATEARLNALRRYQQGELLRIGTCDAFGLLDLKTVTVQLSLLADGLIHACLRLIRADFPAEVARDLVVIACGKLGGEELNYSSDIDLIFLTRGEPARWLPLGQKLIQAIGNSTADGFLYRVDMRLRPWGKSGPLVNSIAAHLRYLEQHAAPWERQALLKARVVAGDGAAGAEFLRGVDGLIYGGDPNELRRQVREAKQRIEEDLTRKGRTWGELKSGEGSLRDVEFIAQYLQLVHGRARPELRTFNTLDALVRLADGGLLRSDEYRQLSTGYLFLRKIEHSLQLMHNKQQHRLPNAEQELADLAARLDFPSGEMLVRQYENHRRAIRSVYAAHLEETSPDDKTSSRASHLLQQLTVSEPTYAELFDSAARQDHLQLLQSFSDERPVAVSVSAAGRPGLWRTTVAGRDRQGILSLICGLLYSRGFNIIEGRVFTDDELATALPEETSADMPPLFLNYFLVESTDEVGDDERIWSDYADELCELHRQLSGPESRQAPAKVARLASVRAARTPSVESPALQPVRFRVDNDSDDRRTILHIQSDDTPGFLYELTNALTLCRTNIVRMSIATEQNSARDMLYVTDESGRKIEDEGRLKELTTAVLLVKHCMHLLPSAPNPESAWLHLRDFLEQLFQQRDWYEQIGELPDSQLVGTLTRILGVSDYLWQDFLRLHHDSVLPFVQQAGHLAVRRTRDELERSISGAIGQAATDEAKKRELNRFKDRETFRTDMRHLLGYFDHFDAFSDELTDVCEAVVAAAVQLAQEQTVRKHGRIFDAETSQACPLSVLALGKCGGRELGFASDIELMFVYRGRGKSDGPRPLRESFYFDHLIRTVAELIEARREGIFELDLRLRPFGTAGPLSVSEEAFRSYFSPSGPAWPYERQALVKLRPIAGDPDLGRAIERLRDELIYSGDPFDVTAMRGMREQQILQLVEAGEVNVKLSPGGLVDVEYCVQGLQIAHGGEFPELRVTNTLAALAALRKYGIITDDRHADLKAAYEMLRRLIDALRMVRGNARDLTLPDPASDEFEFLARRMGFARTPRELLQQWERHSARVLEIVRGLADEGAFGG